MEVVEVKDKVFRRFITLKQIERVVQKIADSINQDYKEKNPLLLGVLNGAFIFAADLMRMLTIPCQISFVKYASYAGTRSTEEVKELIGMNEGLRNRHVIVVEDIVDSGITMDYLLKDIRKYNPASVRLACFCLKPEAFEKKFTIDYLGLEIPNAFIVGYGLDYDGFGRNLPEIYKLEN
jgi:hypoxanthine phosphoribosyltransferase